MNQAGPTPHADQRYIEAMLTNDQLQIREIYEKYSERIIRLVTQNNGSRQDAKDIFQEALTAIYQRACKGDFILTCPFEAYLYVVCRGLWLNELKKRRQQSVTIEELSLYEGTEDAFRLAEKMQKVQARDQLFWEQFHSLGERCQEILKLSWMGNAMEKVAEKMDISYAYARKKKSECVKRLMELIKQAPTFTKIKSEYNG